MELAGDLFQATLHALRSDQISTVKERRRDPRVGLRCALTIATRGVLGKLETRHVWLRDISKKGIGLLHEKSLRRGSSFLLQLPRRDSHPLSLLCKVERTQDLGDGLWLIGASFTEIAQRLNGERVSAERTV